MKKTLEDYFRDSIESRNIIDFALRAQIEPDGRVTFYIHPDGHDGDTADFEVDGNVLAHNRDILYDSLGGAGLGGQ